MAARESRRVIALYNRVARALVEYEFLWHADWLRRVHAARAALDCTLILKDPATGACLAPQVHTPWSCGSMDRPLQHAVVALSALTQDGKACMLPEVEWVVSTVMFSMISLQVGPLGCSCWCLAKHGC